MAKNAEERGKPGAMGKIIAVTNQKGGVGKTTTCVNLSAALGLKGKKILLIDIDPQGNSTQGLGVAKNKLKNSTYDMLVSGVPAEEIVMHTEFQNVDLLPTNNTLLGAEIEMVALENREFRLKNALKTFRAQYDFIFIDCPPSIGLLTLNALCATDTFILPIQCEFYALEGLSQLMSHIRVVKRMYNPLIEAEGVLLSMYDGRLNLTQQVADEVKKYFPRKVYKTTIPRSVRLSEAPSYGKPICYYDRTCKGAKAYESLAQEFLKQNP